MDLKERAKWIITIKTNELDLSIAKIAKKIGFNKETVRSYRNMITNPKVEFIKKFCSAFNVDFMWFADGIGEPFPGARRRYPEVCGPQTNPREPAAGGTAEERDPWGKSLRVDVRGEQYDITEYSPETELSTDVKAEAAAIDAFGYSVAILREIYDSRNPALIAAIEANLREFRKAARREHQILQQQTEINQLKQKSAAVERKMAILEKKLADQKKIHPNDRKSNIPE